MNLVIIQTGCMDSTSLTTVIESVPASSGLSGELSCEYAHASSSLIIVIIMMRLCHVYSG